MKITRKHLILLMVLLVELTLVSGMVISARADEKLNARKIGDYQEPLRQGNVINVTYTLENDYFEPLLNVTLKEKVPTQHLRVLQTANSNNRTLLSNATMINASWTQINPGERVDFWITYNVTATPGTIIVLDPTNITYYLIKGVKESVTTNSLSFLVARINTTTTAITTTVSFKTLGTNPVPDLFVGLMYIFPILVMLPTYVIWRMLKR